MIWCIDPTPTRFRSSRSPQASPNQLDPLPPRSMSGAAQIWIRIRAWVVDRSRKQSLIRGPPAKTISHRSLAPSVAEQWP